MNLSFALIGPGRVGSAIARALFEQGHLPVAIIGRDLNTSQQACTFIGCAPKLATTDLRCAATAELILVAVPDDRIGSVAHLLQRDRIPRAGATLLHFSGALPAAIMRYPESQAALFSLHPLLPFADRQQAYERLPQAPYIGEGDATATPLAAKLCAALGGQLQEIPADKKQLYHAAACMASNYLVTLIAMAIQLLEDCGFDGEQSNTLLMPLLAATLENVAAQGPGSGLTGPIVRGDSGTLKAHLQALKQNHSDLLNLYCLLGRKTVQLAKEAGRLDTTDAEAMHQTMNEYSFTSFFP